MKAGFTHPAPVADPKLPERRTCLISPKHFNWGPDLLYLFPPTLYFENVQASETQLDKHPYALHLDSSLVTSSIPQLVLLTQGRYLRPGLGLERCLAPTGRKQRRNKDRVLFCSQPSAPAESSARQSTTLSKRWTQRSHSPDWKLAVHRQCRPLLDTQGPSVPSGLLITDPGRQPCLHTSALPTLCGIWILEPLPFSLTWRGHTASPSTSSEKQRPSSASLGGPLMLVCPGVYY